MIELCIFERDRTNQKFGVYPVTGGIELSPKRQLFFFRVDGKFFYSHCFKN